MNIVVVDYNPEWPFLFQKEADSIKEILKDELVEIHHIGSTSVKNLKAKPIIDIIPVVNNIEKVDKYNHEFENLGYELMGEYGIKGRRFFRKGLENRTHHIHIFEVSDTHNIKRHLAVRDYLRTHPEKAHEYGELKQELANKYPYDIESYCLGKDSFVKELEKNAVAWYNQKK
ncbi:GrpB family protein [Clostridium sp. CCUG 7971]|uniref:GrpB family protein n=1 Tax=Clostridium sp. CCUG 7971 TaxID=2811414 RepID=UPI001ABB79E8|nr:GrpB family protein [Clostridium sp. CCUG 7971]MBO3444915.1 GrpB family protein [Clostridium sp. CCUG 7971]